MRPCGKSTLEAAIFDIEKHTCVRFKELSYDSSKDVFENKSSTSPLLFVTGENEGCFAGIGYKKIYKKHNVRVCPDFVKTGSCQREPKPNGCSRGWHHREDLIKAKKLAARKARDKELAARKIQQAKERKG